MANETDFSNEPVTTVFSWKVNEGSEKIFMHMMHDIHKVARTFPGHMGVTTLTSPTQKGSFQTVLRFDTTEHLEKWLASSIRRKMMQPLQKYAHVDTSTKATGLETWFEIPDQFVTPPPRWKMVIVTFIGIYPISLLFGLFLNPYLTSLPVAVRALFLPIIAPPILTYLLMPFLTQYIFKRWLY